MGTFGVRETVGKIVTRRLALSRVFEELGIDYYCGGGNTLEEACREKNLDPDDIVGKLSAAGVAAEAGAAEIGVAAAGLTELVNHIEQTHHAYLRSELPHLQGMTGKVASVHGDRDSRLHELQSTFWGLVQELSEHMMKEEHILFPMVRAMDSSENPPESHCGSISNPIRQMELEHDRAGSALARQRDLTDGFTAPEWACNTYRAMLGALLHLERDLHQHIHKENNVMFPRAIELEVERLGKELAQ